MIETLDCFSLSETLLFFSELSCLRQDISREICKESFEEAHK